MENTDWNFLDEIIDWEDQYYYGEVDENNKPNGFGFALNRDTNTLTECYWEANFEIGLTRIIRDTAVSIGNVKNSKWIGFLTHEF